MVAGLRLSSGQHLKHNFHKKGIWLTARPIKQKKNQSGIAIKKSIYIFCINLFLFIFLFFAGFFFHGMPVTPYTPSLQPEIHQYQAGKNMVLSESNSFTFTAPPPPAVIGSPGARTLSPRHRQCLSPSTGHNIIWSMWQEISGVVINFTGGS